MTLSGFVMPEELACIESGEVVDVLLRGGVALHGDVGEAVPLGDVACTLVGGELSPFAPPRRG
ncbi:hypothetical protein QOL99_16525 [Deinococcus sp. MIMF12]|uniref:Uncharacterized protein n=1 Tax=Deinococcus rhizophilus TaxID=3049544 RepID=A0ABT7JQ25_9DEIO|nr:hypothetical protein [Deinococcus rhizophilus]MDL2345739.1 hypothetical protein [Deinococcus rhizophilus]